MKREDIEGREVAEKILRSLGFTHFMKTQGNVPIDLVASNGKERYLIELKYVKKPEDEPLGIPRNTSGFQD